MIADQLKTEASGTVIALRRMGIRVCMLTGDNRRTANAIAERVGHSLYLYLGFYILVVTTAKTKVHFLLSHYIAEPDFFTTVLVDALSLLLKCTVFVDKYYTACCHIS